MKKIEKEFELVNRIIERHWNRAIGLANAESLMTYSIGLLAHSCRRDSKMRNGVQKR